MLRHPLLPLLLLLVAVACDNVGRAFDPDVGGDNPGPETGTSIIQVVPAGGDVRDGRPRVRATYPDGAGWPTSVPVVVEFSESVNEASLLPTSVNGTDGRIGVRLQGTTQLLPCQYDLLAGGRLLVMRPINGLPDNGGAIYEVVLFADSRDVDGVRFSVNGGETVLSDFQTNQDASQTDGRIVALYPRDNFQELPRESNIWMVFDRPANPATLIDANLFVRPTGGSALAVDLGAPLNTIGVADTRVLRINPDATLAAAQSFEVVVTESVTFGQSGRLDFNGRTPFAKFTTVAPAAPTGVELGNPMTGFPNKINRQNALTTVLHVTTPADAVAGDRVRARIYGGDHDTAQTFDLTFVERVATVPADGAQTVLLDFGGQLGTLSGPKLDDGSITFVAQMQRGSRSSGFIRNATSADPVFDVTPPVLGRAGPPATDDLVDLLTDQEYVAFGGLANEAIAAATIDDTVNPTADLWASNDAGRFLMLPLALGRPNAARNYSLVLTDRAGNMAMPVTGRILQRGIVTGTLAGTLTVEAYDEATLRPIVGATVLVDAPATAQQLGTTDANGRASFATAAATHTVTIVRAGYGLVSMLDTQAAFLSLPLRSNTTADATATFQGTVTFDPTPGTTVLVSNSALASADPLGIETSSTAPNEIPATAILPNRVQVITGFGGSFEPTATPTYSLQGCQLLGPALVTPTVPGAPAPAGAVSAQQFVIADASTTFSGLIAPRTQDFATATDLDLGNLVGGAPAVRVTSSLLGIDRQVLTGVGAVLSTSGTQYTVDATFSLPIIGGLVGFTPLSWLLTHAQDTSGRVSRIRELLDPTAGTIAPGIPPSGIPVITAPSGPSVGGPLVTFQDVLVPNGGIGLLALYDVTATDSAGRRWRLLVPDRDAIGGTDQVQFPAFTAAPVAGLAAGTWNVVVEARAFLSLTASTVDDFVLVERIRQEVNYSRAVPVAFTVQ